MANTGTLSIADKIRIFAGLFRGRLDVHGTQDLTTGRGCMVKEPVTADVVRAHLEGKRRLGIYMLVGWRTSFLAVDFDMDDLHAALDFIAAARHYGLPCHLEVSKRRGWHAWAFASDQGGLPAAKARLVARHILEEIGEPGTEVFPKQDALDESTSYGNFIYLPLFGGLTAVPDRTVFPWNANSCARE